MTFPRWFKRLLPILVCLVLLVAACSKAPNKYDQVQKETTGWGAPAAVSKKAEQGATFNSFFPGSQGDYEVIPAQEKKGFAEYKLNQNGQTVAMLSISDTTNLPSAAEKYANATEKISGYPAVNLGTTATSILVNDRYQVKVLSRSPNFTQEDRVAWIQKFDLKGLSQLKGAIAPSPKTTSPNAGTPTRPRQSPPQPDLSPNSAGSAPPRSPVLSPQPAT